MMKHDYIKRRNSLKNLYKKNIIDFWKSFLAFKIPLLLFTNLHRLHDNHVSSLAFKVKGSNNIVCSFLLLLLYNNRIKNI